MNIVYQTKLGKLIQGDCLEQMKYIEDESIDMILCDLPYGSTKNKWDLIIPLDKLWEQYERVIKSKGVIVLTAQTPFDKVLGSSNLKLLKYEWIWEKEQGTGHLNSKYAPLKIHENILVFSKKSACYVKDINNAMNYYPQMSEGKPYTTTKGSLTDNYDRKWDKIVTTVNSGDRFPTTVNSGDRFPTTVLRFKRDKEKLHPTQKPVSLMEYLILTYTKEGDLVLDNTCGSGSTLIASENLKRRWIGIELENKYCDITKKRLENIIK